MDQNLFTRCGGETQISKLVDFFYLEKIIIDWRFKERFDQVDKPRLTEQSKIFLAQLFGCPNAIYTGRELIEVHQPLKITSIEFDAFIQSWRFLIEDFIFDNNIVIEMLTLMRSLKPLIVFEAEV